MNKSQSYKGYVIRAEPVQIDPIRWTVAVVIERQVDETIVKRGPYEAEGTRLTEDEAIASSLAFGRQIVDGRHPGRSLP